MTDPLTGIHEPTVVIPWWLDCRDAEAKADVTPDKRHEKGCVRRYGGVPDKWVPHEDCPCHTMRKAYLRMVNHE